MSPLHSHISVLISLLSYHSAAHSCLCEFLSGLGSILKAEGCLSQAEWTVIKTPGCSRTTLQQLHRNLGRLYTASGNHQSALQHFANDVSVYLCAAAL